MNVVLTKVNWCFSISYAYLQLIGMSGLHKSDDWYGRQGEDISLLMTPTLRGSGGCPIVKLKINIVKSGNKYTNMIIL